MFFTYIVDVNKFTTERRRTAEQKHFLPSYLTGKLGTTTVTDIGISLLLLSIVVIFTSHVAFCWGWRANQNTNNKIVFKYTVILHTNLPSRRLFYNPTDLRHSNNEEFQVCNLTVSEATQYCNYLDKITNCTDITVICAWLSDSG